MRQGAIFGDVGGATLVSPHIVLDVSCDTRIHHQSHFSWQPQYLVKLEGDFYCSAHCTATFM